MTRVAKLVGAILAALVLAVVSYVVAPLNVSASTSPSYTNPAPYAMPDGMVHWMAEFEPGSDLAFYADWVLDEVGVPAAERGGITADGRGSGRYPDGGLMWDLDAIGLFLTAAEAAKANSITDTSPMLNTEVAGTVSLPTPVDNATMEPLSRSAPASASFIPRGQRGVQEVPAALLRAGVPVDDWQYAPSPGKVRVGVLDTGIDGSHPDLNVAGGFNCSQDDRGPDGYDIDYHGHGTWVGGRIGAKHDDAYVTSAWPGGALYSEAVFSTGSASAFMVACGLNQALAHDVDIISASLGGVHIPTRCGGGSVYVNLWCKASRQAVVVVAAGNDASDAIHFGPANTDSPTVVTVGAIVDFDGLPGGLGTGGSGCGFNHADDHLAVFSNHGPLVDVQASGGCELSTTPYNSLGESSGTSMSTPMVASIFAATAAKFPDCRGRELVRMVLTYAERWARDHPDEGYDGWPGADPPPLIRWVDEVPIQGYVDPDSPRPCAFESEVRS